MKKVLLVLAMAAALMSCSMEDVTEQSNESISFVGSYALTESYILNTDTGEKYQQEVYECPDLLIFEEDFTLTYVETKLLVNGTERTCEYDDTSFYLYLYPSTDKIIIYTNDYDRGEWQVTRSTSGQNNDETFTLQRAYTAEVIVLKRL